MIEITENARLHIIAMLERSGMPAVRLGLEEQGCNGYKYVWEPVGSNLADHTIELDPDHYVVLTSEDYKHFTNSTVILEITRFDKKLGIINPNVDGSCGCGESVNFK